MDEVKMLDEALEKHLRIATFPVGIKISSGGEKIPQKARYPRQALGHPLALCQGVTIARTYRWTLVFGKEDHICPGALVYLGHVSPELYLQGNASTLYVENQEIGKKMEATFPLMPEGSVAEVWISPLKDIKYDPDVAIVYGMPGQIVALIQAANFRKGTGINSRSAGRGGCSAWLAGIRQTSECTYIVPGGGEKIFRGTQDHEMAFAIPRSKFRDVFEGLDYVRRQGATKYPVPIFGVLAEPKFPEKYKSIIPR